MGNQGLIYQGQVASEIIPLIQRSSRNVRDDGYDNNNNKRVLMWRALSTIFVSLYLNFPQILRVDFYVTDQETEAQSG